MGVHGDRDTLSPRKASSRLLVALTWVLAGVIAYACNFSTQEIEGGGWSQVQGQPRLDSKTILKNK